MNIVGLYRGTAYPDAWCRISHHPSGDYYVEWSDLGPGIYNPQKIKKLAKDLSEANYKRDEASVVAEILKTYEV